MSALRAARLAAAASTAGVAVVAVERASVAPVAYHEAGHALLAAHIADDGLVCSTSRARFTPAEGHPELLRFATIVPRVTEKGQTYMGETKLTVRWRNMHDHLAWAPRDASGDGDGVAVLGCVGLDTTPATMLTLARIAYLCAGRVAEDKLAGSGHASDGSTAGAIAAMVAQPGAASGDLRKSLQLARKELGGPAQPAAAECGPAGAVDGQLAAMLEAAYAYSERVLAARWAQVGALSGALLVRGRVSGSQLCALLEQHEASKAAAGSAADDGAQLVDRALAAAAHWPLVFGALWAASSRWPMDLTAAKAAGSSYPGRN